MKKRLLALTMVLVVLTACTKRDREGQILFDRYDNQTLSQLKLVKRDGGVLKPASFSVNYQEIIDFKGILPIDERKEAFFAYLLPGIEYQNQLLNERRWILKGIEIKLNNQLTLSPSQKGYMRVMRTRYRVPDESSTAEAVALLLNRVDVLPASMVLAQAALESAWGTSRFARQANNLFGQWCFTRGCGLVPTRRAEGENHEVQAFSSIDRAIEAYFLNINTHPGYQLLRDIRQQLHLEDKPLSGVELVYGLESYSARGTDYVKELINMIRFNDLEPDSPH